jgi:hypothetical protein
MAWIQTLGAEDRILFRATSLGATDHDIGSNAACIYEVFR